MILYWILRLILWLLRSCSAIYSMFFDALWMDFNFFLPCNKLKPQHLIYHHFRKSLDEQIVASSVSAGCVNRQLFSHPFHHPFGVMSLINQLGMYSLCPKSFCQLLLETRFDDGKTENQNMSLKGDRVSEHSLWVWHLTHYIFCNY